MRAWIGGAALLALSGAAGAQGLPLPFVSPVPPPPAEVAAAWNGLWLFLPPGEEGPGELELLDIRLSAEDYGPAPGTSVSRYRPADPARCLESFAPDPCAPLPADPARGEGPQRLQHLEAWPDTLRATLGHPAPPPGAAPPAADLLAMRQLAPVRGWTVAHVTWFAEGLAARRPVFRWLVRIGP